jgi:hypothetical protein
MVSNGVLIGNKYWTAHYSDASGYVSITECSVERSSSAQDNKKFGIFIRKRDNSRFQILELHQEEGKFYDLGVKIDEIKYQNCKSEYWSGENNGGFCGFFSTKEKAEIAFANSPYAELALKTYEYKVKYCKEQYAESVSMYADITRVMALKTNP